MRSRFEPETQWLTLGIFSNPKQFQHISWPGQLDHIFQCLKKPLKFKVLVFRTFRISFTKSFVQIARSVVWPKRATAINSYTLYESNCFNGKKWSQAAQRKPRFYRWLESVNFINFMAKCSGTQRQRNVRRNCWTETGRANCSGGAQFHHQEMPKMLNNSALAKISSEKFKGL